MKILLVITKGEIGGAQMVALNLATGLKAQGADVMVGVGQESFLTAELSKKYIPVVIFKNLKRTFNPIRSIASFFEFKKFLDKNTFDAIQLNSSNSLFAAMAGKLAKNKPKILFTFHGLSYLDPGSDKNWLVKKMFTLAFQTLLRFVDEKIFVCQANLDEAKKIGLVKNGTVIPNEVDPEPLPGPEARKFLSDKIKTDLSQKIILGSIGRLAYPKNYEYFIREMKEITNQHQDIIGIIIGEGPERKKYEQLIKQLGLENKFFLAGEIVNAGKYLLAFDAFVLCSKYEGASITLLEAQSVGLTIFASATGGTPEILKNSGNLFNLNPGALAEIITKNHPALINKKEYNQTANKSQEMARQYIKLFYEK